MNLNCSFKFSWIWLKGESAVAQSCLTLSDPMDCSLPGSSVHRIFQARHVWGLHKKEIKTQGGGHTQWLFFQWLMCYFNKGQYILENDRQKIRGMQFGLLKYFVFFLQSLPHSAFKLLICNPFFPSLWYFNFFWLILWAIMWWTFVYRFLYWHTF